MRISGGKARGIKLQTPPGEDTRPATDGLRQSVFSCLASWLPEAWFLDLFAGSGAYGLEALSRGATGGVWVEKNARAVACIRANLGLLQRSLGQPISLAEVVTGDALNASWPPRATASLSPPPSPDLVFVDPPYAAIPDLAPKLFENLDALLAPAGDPVVVFEMPGDLALPWPGWGVARRLGRGAGQPTAVVYRKAHHLS